MRSERAGARITYRRVMIMMVLGPIDPDRLGFTLPHEHVMVDFGGAATAGPHLYDRDEVVRTMAPHLRSATL